MVSSFVLPDVRVLPSHLHHSSIHMSNPVQYLSDGLELCQRCKSAQAVLVSRKEKFCAECFVFFMRGKQRKQMLDERYKVKYGASLDRLGTQRVLLPLSFGASSLVLFDMIASLLQEQKLTHKGKQGFELVVLHIREDENASEKFQSLAVNYLPLEIAFKVIDIDQHELSEKVKITVSNEFDVVAQKLNADLPSLTVSQLLQLSPSKSLRADLLAIIYEDVIFQTALAEGCQTVLFGHSMTRLATEVISLTVKGRGLQIYQEIADGPRIFQEHTIQVIYPLREVLFAEVDAVLKLRDRLLQYANVPEQSQTRIVKNMTVQALVSQYFDNLDATGYASTASTVVKTAEKLGGPKEPKVDVCQVCGCNIHQDARTWLRNITVVEAAQLDTDEERKYAEVYELEFISDDVGGLPLTVCYGCTVTLAGAGSGFVWPVRSTKEEILDEFVLTDEE